MAISAVLLAYKEAENLKVLLPKIKQQLDKIGEEYEIIIVDTMKPLDDTPAVCKKFGARYVNQRLPHFGGAFRTGIKAARYDKFLIMDSDGSHNPIYIPDIYKKFVSGADVVIGSRYVKGGKTNDSKVSIIMSHILNFVFRIITGIKAKDISTDFRMYDTKQLKAVKLTCQNYDILQEVLEATKGKLLIFVTHRLSFARQADQILYLKKGMIAEHGTHEELMEKGGDYCRMFTTQRRQYFAQEGENDAV